MGERKELPDAVYAAAGAGEVALERLRKLPETAARTWRTASATADGLRERLRTGDRDVAGELAGGLATVRESARSGAATLAARAVSGYRNLVVRGERVVSERFGVTTGQAEPPRKIKVEVGDIRRNDATERNRADGDPGVGETGTASGA